MREIIERIKMAASSEDNDVLENIVRELVIIGACDSERTKEILRTNDGIR